MDIIKNTEIRNKYHQGFLRLPEDIHQIVIHSSGGGHSANSILRWMVGGERASQYKRGIALFHYLIDLNGDIYNIIDHDRWVYHSSSGRHDKGTIGIEHVNSSWKNNNELTGDQYASLVDLIEYLMDRYDITSILGHGKCKEIYSGEYKRCPGNFDWQIIANHLSAKGYDYDYDKEYFKNIS